MKQKDKNKGEASEMKYGNSNTSSTTILFDKPAVDGDPDNKPNLDKAILKLEKEGKIPTNWRGLQLVVSDNLVDGWKKEVIGIRVFS